MWRKSLHEIKPRRRRDRLMMVCNEVDDDHNANIPLLVTADDVEDASQYVRNNEDGNVQGQNEMDLLLQIIDNNEQGGQCINVVENERYAEQRVEQLSVEEEMGFLISDEHENNSSESEEEMGGPNMDDNVNIPLYHGAPITVAQKRKKRKNMLLLGLWYGPIKPDMNRFFYTFREDLEVLAHRGIDIEIERENWITVKGIMLMGTCDLPAKCQCLNFKQFNSDYGCPSCLCKGERVQI
ncbi:hypothetical protein PV325_010430, partial [Microctonus aethiopoides]